MRVLFGQAYYLRFDPKLWDAMQPYPPLGTLYAAAVLRERGFEVALFDAMLAESESEWEVALDRHRPCVAILYEDNFNYLSKMCLLRMREAAFLMIRAAKVRGATVIVSGADASDHVGEYLREGADHVLLGEGEATLVELMERLRSDPGGADGGRVTPLLPIAGLAGAVVINARRPVLRDLDRLPFPAWDLIDLDRYRRAWLGRHGRWSMNLVTTRGCPYHCNWCAKPIWGQRYNVRSVENVVAEMKLLRDRFRPDHLWFADDILGLKPGWIESFSVRLAEEGFTIPFKCLSRADLLLRKGEIAALARAGCECVWIGAESGSQKILDAMDKGTTVDQIRRASRSLRTAGIKVGFFLQFGYPGESIADIDLTFEMVRECLPDEIGISVSYPLPGTKFYESVRGQLGNKQNWNDSSDLDMMYKGPYSTAFYRKLHALMHKQLRSWRTWDDLRRAPVEMFRHLEARKLRRTAGLLYRTATLPFDRRELLRLAAMPHRGMAPLRGRLSPEEASLPSPPDPPSTCTAD